MKKEVGSTGLRNPEQHKLNEAIDKQLASMSTQLTTRRRPGQYCASWELYPTAKDWEVLGDKDTPWSVKIQRVSAICASMGLVLPSEPTRGRILDALLIANELPTERDAAWYKLYDRLSSELEYLRFETF